MPLCLHTNPHQRVSSRATTPTQHRYNTMSNGFWKPDKQTQRAIGKMTGNGKPKNEEDKYGLASAKNHSHNLAAWQSKTWQQRHELYHYAAKELRKNRAK